MSWSKQQVEVSHSHDRLMIRPILIGVGLASSLFASCAARPDGAVEAVARTESALVKGSTNVSDGLLTNFVGISMSDAESQTNAVGMGDAIATAYRVPLANVLF
jgi:hypothetical protein